MGTYVDHGICLPHIPDPFIKSQVLVGRGHIGRMIDFTGVLPKSPGRLDCDKYMAVQHARHNEVTPMAENFPRRIAPVFFHMGFRLLREAGKESSIVSRRNLPICMVQEFRRNIPPVIGSVGRHFINEGLGILRHPVHPVPPFLQEPQEPSDTLDGIDLAGAADVGIVGRVIMENDGHLFIPVFLPGQHGPLPGPPGQGRHPLRQGPVVMGTIFPHFLGGKGQSMYDTIKLRHRHSIGQLIGREPCKMGAPPSVIPIGIIDLQDGHPQLLQVRKVDKACRGESKEEWIQQDLDHRVPMDIEAVLHIVSQGGHAGTVVIRGTGKDSKHMAALLPESLYHGRLPVQVSPEPVFPGKDEPHRRTVFLPVGPDIAFRIGGCFFFIGIIDSPVGKLPGHLAGNGGSGEMVQQEGNQISIIQKTAAGKIGLDPGHLILRHGPAFLIFFQIADMDEKGDLLLYKKSMEFLQEITGKAGAHPKDNHRASSLRFLFPEVRKFLLVPRLYHGNSTFRHLRQAGGLLHTGHGGLHVRYAKNLLHRNLLLNNTSSNKRTSVHLINSYTVEAARFPY